MKSIMRRIGKAGRLFAGVSLLCLTACEAKKTQHLHDAVVQDERGQLYKLKHNIGDTYFIEPLGSNVTWRAER